MSTYHIEPRLKPLLQFMEEGIPFNKHLGMKVVHLLEGHAVIMVPPQPYLVGDPFRPAIHGGVISTLIDVAGGAACFTMMHGFDDRVSTVDLRVDYLRPATAGVELYGEAKVLRMGNKVAVTRMELFCGEERETPVATGQGVYNVLRRSEVTT